MPYHELFHEFGNYKGNYKRRVTAQFSQTIICTTDNEFENFVDHCIAHVHQLHFNPSSTDHDIFYDQIATTTKPRILHTRAERKIQQLKQMTNIDCTGAPSTVWLLALMYVAFLLNHTWSDTIKNVPLTALLGVTINISVLLRYHFWQQVYYKAVEPGFPSDS